MSMSRILIWLYLIGFGIGCLLLGQFIWNGRILFSEYFLLIALVVAWISEWQSLRALAESWRSVIGALVLPQLALLIGVFFFDYSAVHYIVQTASIALLGFAIAWVWSFIRPQSSSLHWKPSAQHLGALFVLLLLLCAFVVGRVVVSDILVVFFDGMTVDAVSTSLLLILAIVSRARALLC